MKKYTFEELNDIEFEGLVNDLLSREFGWVIERFKPGKDGGIDGRFLCFGNSGVIQTKHYRGSTISQLVSQIRKVENKKVLALNPDKYIFVTSLSLSPDNKKKIRKAFDTSINLVENDIFGNNDINAILQKHPDVHRAYYKLWGESSDMLELFSHPEVESRQISLKQRLCSLNRLFVLTESVGPALDILNREKVLVLTGEPGVGKTTLAEYLCQIYIKEGYAIHVIEAALETEPINFADKEKQVLYYFDDFLGTSYFSSIVGQKDAAIVNIIKQIRSETNKRLILTSRTNILVRAQEASQSYRSYNLSGKQYILNVNDYSKMTKAKILYNHFWHSDIEEIHKLKVLQDSFYMDVIKHRNFNPRLISFILSIDGLEGDDLCSSMRGHLNNPKQIWDHCYTEQMDDHMRVLVKLCVANGGRIEEDILEEAYGRALVLYNCSTLTNQPTEFQYVIEILCKSLLLRNMNLNGEVFYVGFNPSVTDYVLEKVSSSAEAMKLISSLNTVDSVMFYRNLITNGRLNAKNSLKISEFLLTTYGSYLNNKFLISLDVAIWIGENTENLKHALGVFNELRQEEMKCVDANSTLLARIISNGIKFGISEPVILHSIDSVQFDHDDLYCIYRAIEDSEVYKSVLPIIKSKILYLLPDVIESDSVESISDIGEENIEGIVVSTLIRSHVDQIAEKYNFLSEAELEEIERNVDLAAVYDKIDEIREWYYNDFKEYGDSIGPSENEDAIRQLFENYSYRMR